VCSRRALDVAAVLAGRDGSIVALHVVEPLPSFPHPPGAHEPALAQLREFTEPAIAAGARTTPLVTEGNAVRKIVHCAQEHSCDLVIMGTHGRSGFDRFLIGSVAEKVLMMSPCPVMVVPPAESGAPSAAFRNILCPLDFSPSSLQAMKAALALAKQAAGRLTLLHVVELAEQLPFENRHFSVPEYRGAMEKEGRNRLDELVRQSDTTGCDLAIAVEIGSPWRHILAMAEAQKADLIVLGAIGSGGVLDRILFGSTAQHIVRAAHCPVLTTRAT
jgi:nucleotide-binding universal stress UspA family protein